MKNLYIGFFISNIVIVGVSLLPCKDWTGIFHLSFNEVNIHVNSLIYNDVNTSQFLIRVFHNKLVILLFNLFNRYVQFWNINYLISILSFAGFFGLLYGYWNVITNKIRSRAILFLSFFIIVIPFFEIILQPKINFWFKMLYLVIPYILFSFIGYENFARTYKKKNVIILHVLFLLLTSGWIYTNSLFANSFCVK